MKNSTISVLAISFLFAIMQSSFTYASNASTVPVQQDNARDRAASLPVVHKNNLSSTPVIKQNVFNQKSIHRTGSTPRKKLSELK